MSAEITWHLSRSTGLLAWLLLAVATLWGLLLASRLLERRPSPAWLLDLHRHLGNVTFALTAVHVIAIVLDDFVDYSPAEVLVPLASDVDTTAVTLGVVSLWLLLAVQGTSWMRGRLPITWWRRAHLLSAPLLVLVTVHALMIGTDIDHPLVAIVGLVAAAEVVLVLVLRVTYGRRPLAPRSDRDEGQRREGEAHAEELAAPEPLP